MKKDVYWVIIHNDKKKKKRGRLTHREDLVSQTPSHLGWVHVTGFQLVYRRKKWCVAIKPTARSPLPLFPSVGTAQFLSPCLEITIQKVPNHTALGQEQEIDSCCVKALWFHSFLAATAQPHFNEYAAWVSISGKWLTEWWHSIA